MFNRIRHTLHGFVLGVLLTSVACGYLYTKTHDIKFSSVATNQPAGMLEATNNSASIEKLMAAAATPIKQVKK
jgi:hypothetical protein